jgi:hypothetical protein
VNTVNSKPHRTETLLGLAILSVLTLIGAILFASQYRTNAAVGVYLGRQSAEPSGSLPSAGGATSLVELPAGLVPLTPPESFDRTTLSDKIDGKAELYLSAGFRSLQSQRFQDSTGTVPWMEIFIYDMAEHANAFAVFSSQQRQDAQSAGLGRYSYRTANALYLVHGPYYIEMIAAEAVDGAMTIMQAVAAGFIDTHPVADAAIAEPTLFPPDGLDSDSVTLIAADAFGFQRLDRVYVAEYRRGENLQTAFVSHRPAPGDAAALAEAYRDFLVRFGGTVVPLDSAGDRAAPAVIEILGTYEIVFSIGPYLAGIHEAAALKPALQLAEALRHRIEEATAGAAH